MPGKRPIRPMLEQLEDRFVPASIYYTDGILLVSNPLVQNGMRSLTLTQTNNNQFQIQDGSVNLGTYVAYTDIYIAGTGSADALTVNLGSFTYSGSLLINAGNGNDTVSVTGAGGMMEGNLTAIHGNGNEAVNLNSSTGAGALTVRGTTTIVTEAGNTTVSMGNANGSSQFLGAVNITGADSVQFGAAGYGTASDSYSSNVNISLGINYGRSLTFVQQDALTGTTPDGDASITIGGNLQITGGYQNNTVALGALTVAGNLQVNLGNANGNNYFEIADPDSGVTTVEGSLYYSGNNVQNVVSLENGVMQTNVNIQLGNGADSIAMEQPNPLTPASIGGSLFINKGNGSLDMQGPNGLPIETPINGNFQLQAQNADLNIPFDELGTVGGQINIRAGNGNDSISFTTANSNPTSVMQNVGIFLGNGNDTFVMQSGYNTTTMAPTSDTTTLTGYVIAGTGSNVFQQLGTATIQEPWVLSGF